MASVRQSVCRICTAQCGLLVTVEGDRVVDVRGDPDHPHSQGYTCSKGRALGAFHHDGARGSEHPRVDGATVSWSACLDDLAGRIAAVRSDRGAHTLAVYSSMGTAFDSAGLLVERRLFGALGGPRYSALMLDCGPLLRAGLMVSGSGWELNPTWIPEATSPRVVVLVGCNPVVSHGYQTNLPNPVARIRAFRSAGGEVWVLDPRRTETARIADQHLPVQPGSDAFVLAWLTRELLDEGADREELRDYCDREDVERLRDALTPFQVGMVATRSGVAPEALHGLLAAIRGSGKVAILTGTGAQFSPHALVCEWLRLVIGIVTGSVDRAGGMWIPPGWINPFEARASWDHAAEDGSDAPGPPSRPDLRQLLGEQPAVALVDEIEAGNVRALVVTGGSPLRASPQPDRLRDALRSLDVLAVADVVENELTGLATHVLPVAAMFERSDVTRNKVHTAFAPALLPVGDDRRPAWWVWSQLGRRLGVDVLDGVDPSVCSDEDLNRQVLRNARELPDALFARGPHGVFNPRMWGWFHEHALPGGRWRIAPAPLVERLASMITEAEDRGDTLRFVSRHVVRAHNAVRYTTATEEHRGRADLHIHPDDAHARTIRDGDHVRVASAPGTVLALARLDDRMAPGTVSITHGHDDPNVADLVPPEADPLTGQPLFSGFPVTVAPDADRRTRPA